MLRLNDARSEGASLFLPKKVAKSHVVVFLKKELCSWTDLTSLIDPLGFWIWSDCQSMSDLKISQFETIYVKIFATFFWQNFVYWRTFRPSVTFEFFYRFLIVFEVSKIWPPPLVSAQNRDKRGGSNLRNRTDPWFWNKFEQSRGVIDGTYM